MQTRITVAVIVVMMTVLAAGAAASDDNPVPERVMVSMPDGVRLATDVYTPEGDGPWPVILIRSPYGGSQMDFIAEYFVDAGYVTVVQNVRGQSGSEGQFFPFVFEERDGLAALDWLVEQPWCDGRVGVWGESYLGYAGLVLTVHDHDALKAVVNIAGMGDMEWFMAPGGAMHLMAHFPWVYFNMGGGKMVPWEQWMMMFQVLPAERLFMPPGAEDSDNAQSVMDMAVMFRGLEGRFDQVDVPILHIAGWQDFVYESTLRTYEGVDEQTDTEQRLVIGPWYHDQVFIGESLVGERDFGDEAKRPFSEMMSLCIQWFDRHVKGEAGEGQSAPVRLFVNDENRWHEFDSWPPEDTTVTAFYCHPGEDRASGSLRAAVPPEAAEIEYTYDPSDPVPTLGGDLFHYFKEMVGYRDHAALLLRDDVAVFSTPPLQEPLTIIGNLKAEVWLSTTGADADVTAWVTIAYPDGRVELMEEGILRASAAGIGGEEGFQSNTPYRYEVECGATAWQVPAGARIQLLISSSNFPKYVRNPGTGEDAMTATELQSTQQTIHMSPDHPSALLLPVLEDK